MATRSVDRNHTYSYVLVMALNLLGRAISDDPFACLLSSMMKQEEELLDKLVVLLFRKEFKLRASQQIDFW